MANITEVSEFTEDVYLIATTDQVLGGEGGISNLQAQALANRTLWLKEEVEALNESDAALINYRKRSLGAASLIKQGIIRGKKGTGSNSALPVYLDDSTIGGSSGTVQLTADSTNPFIFSVTGGYDANGPVNIYARVTANLTQAFSGSGIKLILLNVVVDLDNLGSTGTNTGTVSLLVEANNGFVYSYTEPTPVDGMYWYDLDKEQLFKRESGVWNPYYRIIIGYLSTALTDVFYDNAGTIGKSAMTLYGRGHVPAGTVNAFAGEEIPHGYLTCDGSAISRTTYSDLFQAIGTTYGVGNGTTTFNIPDLRGEFIRGFDDGRGVDSGRVLGSAQADELKAHTHFIGSVSSPVGKVDILTSGADIFVGSGFSTDSASTGGAETRPRNIAMNYIIKF